MSNKITTFKYSALASGGFGIISKTVMRDRVLSLTSKSIYAFLCSISNGETLQSYESVECNRKELGISKDAFYKHSIPLYELGFVSKYAEISSNGTKQNNIYTIEEYPLCLNPINDKSDVPSRERSIKDEGYGMIPRNIMKSDSLSVKAKGLYAYLASFSGAGMRAELSYQTVLFDLSISGETYRKLIKELVDSKFVLTCSIRENGRLSGNITYYIAAEPGVFPTYIDSESGSSSSRSKSTSKKDTEKQDMDIQDTGFQDSNINSSDNNSFITTSPIIIYNKSLTSAASSINANKDDDCVCIETFISTMESVCHEDISADDKHLTHELFTFIKSQLLDHRTISYKKHKLTNSEFLKIASKCASENGDLYNGLKKAINLTLASYKSAKNINDIRAYLVCLFIDKMDTCHICKYQANPKNRNPKSDYINHDTDYEELLWELAAH